MPAALPAVHCLYFILQISAEKTGMRMGSVTSRWMRPRLPCRRLEHPPPEWFTCMKQGSKNFPQHCLVFGNVTWKAILNISTFKGRSTLLFMHFSSSSSSSFSWNSYPDITLIHTFKLSRPRLLVTSWLLFVFVLSYLDPKTCVCVCARVRK